MLHKYVHMEYDTSSAFGLTILLISYKKDITTSGDEAKFSFTTNSA